MAAENLVVIDFPDAALARDFIEFMREIGEQDYGIWRSGLTDARVIRFTYPDKGRTNIIIAHD